MANYLDENALRYLWSKITGLFARKSDVPTKTSQLQNDSKFVTENQIPEGATASNTVPKMDGTAAVGTELAFARGDHVHPTDTSRAAASDLESLKAIVREKADKATTLAGYGITDAYTKGEVDAKIGSVYKPAGSIAFDALPTPAAENIGNVYSLTDNFTTDERFIEGAGKTYPAGTNVAVVSVESEYKFDVLSGFVDLSGYWGKNELTAMQNADIDDIVSGGSEQ